MTPDCERVIEEALAALPETSASPYHRRYRWGAVLTTEHRASLSAALDVTYGYEPGAGCWWIDRSMAVAPLRLVAKDSIEHHSDIPLIFVHKRRFSPDTIWAVLSLKSDHPRLRDAYLDHAKSLPHGLLYTDFLELAGPPPRPRKIEEPRQRSLFR